jgi:hypothetical protein
VTALIVSDENEGATGGEPHRDRGGADHKDDIDTDAMGTLVAELDLEEQQIRTALGER